MTETRVCVDCGREFESKTKQQIRCPECQREHRREHDRKRKRREYKGAQKTPTKSMIVNGHVQVCDVLHKCYYGNGNRSGCAYTLEEGVTRASRGLWIENGICPAYRPKKKGDELRRCKPCSANRDYLTGREMFNEFNEI